MLTAHRAQLRHHHLCDQYALLETLRKKSSLHPPLRQAISKRAEHLINDIRQDDRPALLEVFLAEYGLSTKEGIALMCLAEALMRVPDTHTMDELIEDKIAPSSWQNHRGNSKSTLVNASTWGLMLTGKILNESEEKGVGTVLHGLVKRLGEPVIRTAVKRAMKELGGQFVLGETISEALKRGKAAADEGYTFSYDMLGEAALTARDADKFFTAYHDAISQLAKSSKKDDPRENPGISIKLSALHPRYEVSQRARVMDELVKRTLDLALLAREANMGLNIDAEEADRLDLSLDVIEAVLQDPRLAGWDGFGVVVQAYGKRASFVLDWLYTLATNLDRKIMVRLVKGAYWDTEIKRSQVENIPDFPVFTHKSATDCSYLLCAEKLLSMTDRIYPQFATHNAHSVAAILEMTSDRDNFEFQRLHGMGEIMHRLVLKAEKTRCRIYAPVGPHRDLLAYLVRRLLENGANSSFVNQIVDEQTPAALIAQDPFEKLREDQKHDADAVVVHPNSLFAPERPNSKSWDLHDVTDLATIEAARTPFKTHHWHAQSLGAEGMPASHLPVKPSYNPANSADEIGTVQEADDAQIAHALSHARAWSAHTAAERATILNQTADLYETHFGEFFAILTREAGKTPMDAIAEVREAVDFLRYYAAQSLTLPNAAQARGVFSCISPWNFPLAIFTGQIAAALAAGNGVLAKPADQTPLIAYRAIQCFHDAGVPKNVLQLLCGSGASVGAALAATPQAKINRAMSQAMDSDAPLIAETGGLNAMIVDSTALPEQAVKDIVASAFQSAGQRCSALRVLYLQEDVAETFLTMLFGAMDELMIGDPWDLATDLGPVIDPLAHAKITTYVQAAEKRGALLKQLTVPTEGTFVGPCVVKINGIEDLADEIFGPVLHVATFAAPALEQVIQQVNNSGFGLTFGLHTRIDDRIDFIKNRINVGNLYINRNQIGAIVGSQPFGGEGLSGTGPKAGGPAYLTRFTTQDDNVQDTPLDPTAPAVSRAAVQALLDRQPKRRIKLSDTALPGPTGESNRLSTYGRGVILCLGPTFEMAQDQASLALAHGCQAIIIAPDAQGEDCLDGVLERSALKDLTGFNGVMCWSDEADRQQIRQVLASRDGAILPFIGSRWDLEIRLRQERHICIDTTAAGGNAALLAEAS